MMKLMIVFQFSFFMFILLLMFNDIMIALKKGQDERVPVHDGVSLSFAAISLGCHRNTPDYTLPCLHKLLQGYFAILSSSGICSCVSSSITTSWRGITTAWSGFSCRTVIGWILGATALYGIHTLDSCVKVGG